MWGLCDEIKVGDMVMVVRGAPCCGQMMGFSLGSVFSVLETKHWDNVDCLCCGKHWPNGADAVGLWPVGNSNNSGVDASMLKKLPPLSEDDEMPRVENLEVPA